MEMAFETATLSSKGQITLPKAVRKALRLERGDPMKVELTDDGGIVLRPQKVIDARSALAEQRTYILDDRERDQFLAMLNRPPSVKPNLRSLVERGSVLPQE
jgi:AbrB family looped-hinge helix DNA binding protein